MNHYTVIIGEEEIGKEVPALDVFADKVNVGDEGTLVFSIHTGNGNFEVVSAFNDWRYFIKEVKEQSRKNGART
jgi:hypothetical protein